MSERQVCILGGGMSKWGRRSASLVDVVQEAAKDCFDDIPGIKRKDIDGFLFASSYCGRNPFQVNAAPVMAERIGIKPLNMCSRVDTLCAGGSSAIILATGLCSWRSGPEPVLEAQFNPDFLRGLMAIQWSGQAHDTEDLKRRKRDYNLIACAGREAYEGAKKRDPSQIAHAILTSYLVQRNEGMAKIVFGSATAAKYCGSGGGGYIL